MSRRQGPGTCPAAKNWVITQELCPLRAEEPGLPMAFDIAMGVRKGDRALARISHEL